MLSTLPLSMRMAGPRECMLHALIRKNYGCTHFIVGRDHAGPGSDSHGKDIYTPFEARDFVKEYESELGINLISFGAMKYVPERKKYYDADKIPEGMKSISISGTEVRRRLKTGEDIPDWFSNPAVVQILRESTLNNEMKHLSQQLEGRTPQEIIKKSLELYGEEISISFSGAEDVVLVDLAHKTGLPFRVFTLDTGRVFPET